MLALGNSLPLAQADNAGGAIGGILFLVMMFVWLAITVVIVLGLWKTFEKAGKTGWGAIIPIYNIILLLEIAGKPLWWIILFLIPIVNFVSPIIWILISLDVAKNFGKGAGFGLGLAFLSFIFYPILGFGDAKYQGSGAAA